MIKNKEKTGDGMVSRTAHPPVFLKKVSRKVLDAEGRVLEPLEGGGMGTMGTFASVNHQVGWNLGSCTGSVKGGRSKVS